MKNKYKKIFKLAIANTLIAGAVVAVVPTQVEAAKTFSDVKVGQYHYADILNLAERGYVSGFPDGTYKASEGVKREHAALIIANILKLNTSNVKDPGFKDVPKSNPYYGAIAALKQVGIISGMDKDTFGMNDILSRAQMAVIIKKAFDLESNGSETPFTDIKNSSYKEFISALYVNGVTVGTSPTTYSPFAPVTRGQLATFVVTAEAAKKKSIAEITSDIMEVKDGQVTTSFGVFTVEGDLKKVFNKANAAALANAKVDLEVKYDISDANSLKGRIVDIKGINLVKENTLFDAQGYDIPNLVIEAKNIEVKNVTSRNVSINVNASANLTSAIVEKMEVTAGSTISLDNSSSINVLVVPEKSKVEEVVTNYTDVIGSIKNVETYVEVESPESSEASITELEIAVNGVLGKLVTEKNNGKISNFGKIDFDAKNNTMTVTVNAPNKKIAEVRQFLKAESVGVNATSILENVTLGEISQFLKVESVNVQAGAYVDTFTLTNYFAINNNAIDINRSKLVSDADVFVDEAIRNSGKSIITVGDFASEFNGKVTITVGTIPYTVVFK